MDIKALLSGAAVGAVLGFVFQWGRFCLNTAFRDVIYIKNFTLLRSYLLSLVIALIGANLLEQAGVVSLDQGRQEFAWLANVLGGYIFGIGMVLAGGCAAGTLYRVGEGLVGSWMAALGFMIGAAAMKNGMLSGVYALIRSVVMVSGGGPTIHGVIGVNRWIAVAIMALPALLFVLTGRTSYSSSAAERHWRMTAVLVGLIIVTAWYLSGLTSGRATGISFAIPSERLLMSIVSGERLDWGTAVLIGVPLGSFAASSRANEFSWRAPRAGVVVLQFAGGLIMGLGGMLAGGCLIGHGLSGLSALSISSLVAAAAMILGSWTMVYLLFMRGESSG